LTARAAPGSLPSTQASFASKYASHRKRRRARGR
jgi:hypothetical protein